jgi:hypothetical protein
VGSGLGEAVTSRAEAFASVAIHPTRDLGIGSVVVNGGAIAMGHPPASGTSTYQPEKAANCVLLCEAHHRHVHHTGWEILIHLGHVEFIPPTIIDPTRTPLRC